MYEAVAGPSGSISDDGIRTGRIKTVAGWLSAT